MAEKDDYRNHRLMLLERYISDTYGETIPNEAGVTIFGDYKAKTRTVDLIWTRNRFGRLLQRNAVCLYYVSPEPFSPVDLYREEMPVEAGVYFRFNKKAFQTSERNGDEVEQAFRQFFDVLEGWIGRFSDEGFFLERKLRTTLVRDIGDADNISVKRRRYTNELPRSQREEFAWLVETALRMGELLDDLADEMGCPDS